MSDVSIKIKSGDMRRLKKALALYPKEAPKILSRAINKTATTARTQAVREISADTKLKKSDIYKAGRGKRSPVRQSKANYSNLSATISVTGARIPLSRFRARQVKTGVSYDLGQGRKTIKSAFKATMSSGHEGIFVRSGRRNARNREIIVEKFGPSLPHVFIGAAIIKNTVKTAQSLLSKNIDTQIKLVLQRKRAK